MNKNILTTLIEHKKLLSKFGATGNLALMKDIVRSGEELTLSIANYKCQRCKYDKHLQYHHLITRPMAGYINDATRYLSQRHYWANVIILCGKCHNEVHHRDNIERDEKAFISEKNIIKIRKKYGG